MKGLGVKYQYKPFDYSDEVRDIEIMGHWGCYERRSDKSLTIKANRFVKAMLDARTSYPKAHKSGVKFILAWMRMCRTATHRRQGVSEIEVRDNVWGFLEKVYKIFGYNSKDVDAVWDEVEKANANKEAI